MEHSTKKPQNEGDPFTNRYLERVLEVGKLLLSVLTSDELDLIRSGKLPLGESGPSQTKDGEVPIHENR